MRTFPLVAASLVVAGCTAPSETVDEPVGQARSFITVEEAVTAGCSTSQIEALSLQIIGQGNCIEPGAFSQLAAAPNATFGSAVLPFLEEPARDRLAEALAENAGLNMQINSMLRTPAQQYLLYRWFQMGTCGIGLAASPGNSNHETGLAIDIQQYDAWRTILEAKDFSWLGSGDPVHFDYVGPGAIDHRDLGVLAFQQLWNVNNPSDLITEDGLYGPQTEARVQMAPAEGFVEGPTCGPLPPIEGDLTVSASWEDADDVFADGPSAGVADLFEGSSYELVVSVTNTGDGPVSGATLSIEAPSELSFDEVSVDLPDVPAGDVVDISFVVAAETYSVNEAAALSVGVGVDAATTDIEADVYSDRRWEWEGDRLEGWTSPNGDLALADGQLVIPARAGARTSAIQVPADGIAGVEIVGTGDGAGLLVVASDAGEEIFNVDLTTGRAAIAFEGLTGDITSLRIDADAELRLDAVRLQASIDEALPPTTDDEGCSCRLPGGRRTAPSTALWFALGAAAWTTRRRRRSTR